MVNHPNRSKRTVTRYRITSRDVTLADYYTLDRPTPDDYRYDIDVERYRLPDGYRVMLAVCGERMIYDSDGGYCDIRWFTAGAHVRPQLISPAGNPILQLAV